MLHFMFKQCIRPNIIQDFKTAESVLRLASSFSRMAH